MDQQRGAAKDYSFVHRINFFFRSGEQAASTSMVRSGAAPVSARELCAACPDPGASYIHVERQE
jgi:hypothetical protein